MVVVVMAGGLSLAVSTLAATPEVQVGAHHWVIKVSGHNYRVKAG